MTLTRTKLKVLDNVRYHTGDRTKLKVLDNVRYHTGGKIIRDVWDPLYNEYKKNPLTEAGIDDKIIRLYDDLQFACGNIYNMISDTLKEHDFN